MKISITSLVEPPFVVIAKTVDGDTRGCPMVMAPAGGFASKDEAKAFCELYAEHDIDFAVEGLRDPSFLKRFMSF